MLRIQAFNQRTPIFEGDMPQIPGNFRS